MSTGLILKDRTLLSGWVKIWRKKHEVIVLTNGCFDILHPGHIDILEYAKSLGDKLIVAVNDDESVQRLKGTNRPVNNLASRMLVLSALNAVDWVIPFNEDTPESLIQQLNPDILVKGGDYEGRHIAGQEYLEKQGGKTVIFDFKDDYSTTETINNIRRVK